MRRRKIHTCFLFLLLLSLSFFFGCGHDHINPVAPQSIESLNQDAAVQLSFRIVFPDEWDKNQASILPQTLATPTVYFQIMLFNPASGTTQTLSKVSVVSNQTAAVTFQGLPALPTVGKIFIVGGTLNNVSSFSGSIDLVPGNNVMTLMPVTVNATTTVVAYVVEELAKVSDKFLAAPLNLVTVVNDTISGLSLTSQSIKTDALATVLSSLGDVSSVSLNKSSTSISVGSSETLVATVLPINTKDKTVRWSSSDASCATVQDTGQVTGILPGVATITATAGVKSALCQVTVVGDYRSANIGLLKFVPAGSFQRDRDVENISYVVSGQ